MLKSNFIKVGIGFFLLSSFIFSEGIEDELKKINEKLDKIDKRLINLEKKVVLPPKNDKPKKQQPQTDYNKVYDVPIGNSVVLGNPDAKVTIIKWTDFQ